MNNVELINEKIIKDFYLMGHSLGRDDYFRVVFDVFLESFESDLKALRQACESADCQRVRSLCHRMKSSAFTVGAEMLGRLLVKLETYAEEFYQDSSLYLDLWQQIDVTFKKSVVLIEGYLKSNELTNSAV